MKLLHINRDMIYGGGESFFKPTYDDLYERVEQLQEELYESQIKIEQTKRRYFWTGLWVGLLTYIAFTLIP